MQLIRGLYNIRPEHHGCVLTIGKFDGVHLGHRAVLENLIKKAKELALPTAVMVFEPQPEEFFAPERSPARLSNLRDKYSHLNEIGISQLICIRFNAQFAAQPAEVFVEKLLVQKLGVKFLVVGDDFRFGHKRAGNFDFLSAAGRQHGFAVENTESYTMYNHRISSTAVRHALANGDFQRAKEMLGRDFSMFGKVVHGDKNGRKIGFPTANILVKKFKTPLTGVFAVYAEISGKKHKAIANLGVRPTLAGEKRQLETHLFNYSGDLYGRSLKIHFIGKIRDEKKFTSLEMLKQQIQLDCEQAKAMFN